MQVGQKKASDAISLDRALIDRSRIQEKNGQDEQPDSTKED
jgi:hypothetical protein